MSSLTAAPDAQQQQQPAPLAEPTQAAPTVPAASGGAATASGGARASVCPPHVLEAIYGKQKDKKATYEASLQRWWTGAHGSNAGDGGTAGPAGAGHLQLLPLTHLSDLAFQLMTSFRFFCAIAEYADRKNDETEEYVSNSLLYDRRHLPRTAPAPDCVRAAAAAQQRQQQQQQQATQQAQQAQQQGAAP